MVDAAVAATCTTAGKTEGSHCSVCGTVIVAQKEIPATDHSWDKGTVTKEATCTEAGVKTYKCTKCSATKNETIPATGHKEVLDKAVAATTTSTGLTEGSHCSVCGAVIVAQKVIPKLEVPAEPIVKKDPADGNWYYYVGDKKDSSFTGFAPNSYGWWYVNKGIVDFGKTDVISGRVDGQNAWWFVKGGKVQKGVNSVERNAYGWWRIKDGKVDFNCNSVESNSLGWWYIRGGKVDFSYTGVASNSYGWWRIEGGKVNFGYNGLAKNEYGWWYLRGGKVDFSYNGRATNQYGTWNVRNGKVVF